ncbi:MAG: ORF6N domain-containing protein [bacterium]
MAVGLAAVTSQTTSNPRSLLGLTRDGNLAPLYGVTVTRFNQQIARNRERFPNDFCFQLTETEWRSESESKKLTTIAGNHFGVPGGNPLE